MALFVLIRYRCKDVSLGRGDGLVKGNGLISYTNLFTNVFTGWMSLNEQMFTEFLGADRRSLRCRAESNLPAL